MWPVIVREKNIGKRFEEKFWDSWGPLEEFYANPDPLHQDRAIQSIFCTYEAHENVEFKKEDIALGLHYECGEFGEHTILFSYEKFPEIQCAHIWDCFITKDLHTEDPVLYTLYTLEDDSSEKERYIKYLELQLTSGKKTDKLQKCLERTSFAKDISYPTLLEQLLIHSPGPEDFASFCQYQKKLLETLNASPHELEIFIRSNLEGQVRSLETIRKNFDMKLFEMECIRENNDLDSIFLECLAYLENDISLKEQATLPNKEHVMVSKKIKKLVGIKRKSKE